MSPWWNPCFLFTLRDSQGCWFAASLFSCGDICQHSKPTCLISPLIYMVLDQVLSNSSHTWQSKCRCLSLQGLKTITKTIAAFLPDFSPVGHYFQIPKLETSIAVAGTSAEPVQQVKPNGPRLPLLCWPLWQLCLTGPMPVHRAPASLVTPQCAWVHGEGETEINIFLLLLLCPLLTVGWALLEACRRAPQSAPPLRGFGEDFKSFKGRERDLPGHFWLGSNLQLPKLMSFCSGIRWNRLPVHSTAWPCPPTRQCVLLPTSQVKATKKWPITSQGPFLNMSSKQLSSCRTNTWFGCCRMNCKAIISHVDT